MLIIMQIADCMKYIIRFQIIGLLHVYSEILNQINRLKFNLYIIVYFLLSMFCPCPTCLIPIFFTQYCTIKLHNIYAVSYTHLRAHETRHDLVCRLLLEKKKKK